jgi:CRISPR-associated protein Cas1
MMSLPDFREKQLLIISAKDAVDNKLQFKNENICLTQDGAIINQLSCHKVFAVCIIGDFSITTVLIRNCAQYGVSLFLLKDNLELYASVLSVAAGNYLLREKQYTCTRELEIARHLVANKILNQRILRENIRSEQKKNEIYTERFQELEKAVTAKELLGYEGSETKAYFADYFTDIGWYRRMPRAKVDIPNVLMDVGYTMLFNFVDALLNLYGFDTYKGVYHTLFFQRKSLACDLVEPFRCIVDAKIVKMYNLGQIDERDFVRIKNKYSLSYEFQKKYAKLFSEAIMEYKEEIFLYIRDYYYCIMNDTSDYPVFKIK